MEPSLGKLAANLGAIWMQFGRDLAATQTLTSPHPRMHWESTQYAPNALGMHPSQLESTRNATRMRQNALGVQKQNHLTSERMSHAVRIQHMYWSNIFSLLSPSAAIFFCLCGSVPINVGARTSCSHRPPIILLVARRNDETRYQQGERACAVARMPSCVRAMANWVCVSSRKTFNVNWPNLPILSSMLPQR